MLRTVGFVFSNSQQSGCCLQQKFYMIPICFLQNLAFVAGQIHGFGMLMDISCLNRTASHIIEICLTCIEISKHEFSWFSLNIATQLPPRLGMSLSQWPLKPMEIHAEISTFPMLLTPWLFGCCLNHTPSLKFVTHAPPHFQSESTEPLSISFSPTVPKII